ncbi:hypothetical protein Kpol_1020p52 [Vanderwaltozyma polyspora DSM 70294]|uniref:Uncharacterized protein n=1 Tax=Vanderwaltozyma polyspora (strain ATCC 22028 / DSM 70294 / BCRC 21397 / CBS 2163 / NBRC 10782 / NRRL Y-8283 / UCD 57-17) TaxID=436907 RepID=A7TLG1_VANPO|nr:uncharacterized protein Kpol_1020p52 [Vanderwaltozyma polyspora DSM 70294]EDO16942.1 hypothetical protein Kpol_1020p52 [Vanderwaltozyma polyspora DSM 70294]
MPRFTIPTSSKKLYRLVGLIVILVATIFIVKNGSNLTTITSLTSNNGNSNNNNKDTTKKSSVPARKKRTYSSKYDDDKYNYVKYSIPEYDGKKVKATFVTLARNSDLYKLVATVKSVEDRFNSKFQYDWIFLNDEEFSEDFKKTMTAFISGETKFGVIPKEHWSFPSWIDQDRAKKVREEMKEKKIIYGDSVSYRHMCRFESGFFWRHPLLDDYEYYWRVEPDTKMYCDIDYDVFRFMKDNKKRYGFTISIKEFVSTIPTLWETTTDFLSLHPEYIAENNMLDFVSNDGGLSYNLCHFWSNFEIADLSVWRSKAYVDYFDYLDKAGGFFYERWGDAPVHSIAASLFLNREEIHHFGDLGYYHPPYHQCPVDDNLRLTNKCGCVPKKDFTWRGYSCTRKFYDVNKLKKPANWEDFK